MSAQRKERMMSQKEVEAHLKDGRGGVCNLRSDLLNLVNHGRGSVRPSDRSSKESGRGGRRGSKGERSSNRTDGCEAPTRSARKIRGDEGANAGLPWRMAILSEGEGERKKGRRGDREGQEGGEEVKSSTAGRD